MSTVLDRIRAKVTRAKQHIQEFQLGLQAFYKSVPYAVTRKENAQTGKRIYYVSKAERVPDSLTAIAADVIQNLRSPLDHIAYQLVLAGHSGAEPHWTVYYPISGSAAHYPTTRNGKIKGVRQEVIDAIDATEPYKGGKGHALWQLNELNKPDKHQLLIGAGTIAAVDLAPSPEMDKYLRQHGLPEFKVPPLFIREVRDVPLNVGDEPYIEPIERQMAKDRQFRFDVALYAPGVIQLQPALKTFQDMANLV